MRIAAVSDIHTLPDGSDMSFLEMIRQRVEEIRPEVFVIAGDISDRLSVLEESLKTLRVDGCVNLFVAGNHDIWFEEDSGPGSQEKYSHIVGDVCKENGFLHLPDSPHVIDDYAFVGSLGWYDYSFRREELDIPLENYQQKEYQGSVWYDVFRVDWGFTDFELTDLFNRKLAYDLSTLPKSVKYVVYVSHHLPFQNLTIYKNRLPWDFHGAFMGSTSTGKILLADSRIRLSISGHSHVRNKVENANIVSITVPMGYCRPNKEAMSVFVRDAVAVIEIDDGHVDIPDFVKGDICSDLPYIYSR